MTKRKTKSPAGAMSLFAESTSATKGASARKGAPLAERVRPRSLDAIIGQPILTQDTALGRAIDRDQIPSTILWGPPGCGKTSVARVLAESTQASFVAFNAVLGGVAEVRQIVAQAKEALDTTGTKTILFVDEIHRFNKAQQDAFLPHVEAGTIVLVGATTENPSFSVNAPLLSRCKVFRLQQLAEADIELVLQRALEHPEGLASAISVEPGVFRAIARYADGDARRALATLDVAASDARSREETVLTIQRLAEIVEHKTLLYDKAGEEHYNVVSVFIKSLRGSDPDAAIYWLMRMLEAGDDPLFLLRRMIIFASEDVGNADPRALTVAIDADQAFRRIGMPEGLYPISQAALYLATAPKSNACGQAFKAARTDVAERGSLPVPMRFRNAVTPLMKNEGYGKGYRYAHDEADGVARGEVYLPDELEGRRYYEPTTRGYEKIIGQRMAWLRGEGGPEDAPSPDPKGRKT